MPSYLHAGKSGAAHRTLATKIAAFAKDYIITL
jgi:hypothetical protein